MAIANEINIESQFTNRVICPCGFRDKRIERENKLDKPTFIDKK